MIKQSSVKKIFLGVISAAALFASVGTANAVTTTYGQWQLINSVRSGVYVNCTWSRAVYKDFRYHSEQYGTSRGVGSCPWPTNPMRG